MSDFSQRLKDLRVTLRITQAEMAEKLGVKGNYVSMLERGERNPSHEVSEAVRELERRVIVARSTNPEEHAPRDFKKTPKESAGISTLSAEKHISDQAATIVGLLQELSEARKTIAKLTDIVDRLTSNQKSATIPRSHSAETHRRAVRYQEDQGDIGLVAERP